VYDRGVSAARALAIALALIAAGCAKIVGIEDYRLRDATAVVIDTPSPVDAAIDAPFGTALTYVKASNTGANDQFGTVLALSADGSTLVVGAPFEDSAATGVDGDQASNAAGDSGAVYVFARTGTLWVQQAYLKASNTGGNDRFGSAVAVSADGASIAVGAPLEDSNAVGIDGNGGNNSSTNSGAAYVFVRTGTTWAQQAYVKPSNTGGSDEFGRSVALSGDGSTLAVGAPLEDSDATGINGNQGNADPTNVGTDFGAAYVFVRAGGLWVQQAYVKASNTGSGDRFGTALALSADGDTLAVGAPLEDSNAIGINGNQSNNSATNAGAAYVFRRVAGIWAQQAYVKATNTGADDQFGTAVALSGDGNTLAVGAPLEDSDATGIDGANNNNSGNSGAVYVYAQVAATWTAQAFVKASNTGNGDRFGIAVALTEDGSGLLVGAYFERSAAVGLGGDQTDRTANEAGAAYAFGRSGTTWMQTHYLKATNTQATDRFGQAVAIAPGLFAAGAPQEDGDAVGLGGDQASNAATNSGAAYVVQ
jgi:hypothetical protein